MIYTGSEAKSSVKKGADPDRTTAILTSYIQEAEQARRSGPNPRDAKWEENLDLYWNRHDFSDKLDWQAKETLAEVPNFVDRFAAALKEALVASPEGFYTVVDPADQEHDLTRAVKRVTDVWLSRCGRNMSGHLLGFDSVFEEQVKQGALTAMCSATVWRDDVPGGRVAVEAVDPRNVWLDPTYRGLYRIRKIEIDAHNLAELADRKGGFDKEAIEELQVKLDAERYEREQSTGHGQDTGQTTRQPVQLHEVYGTVLESNGEVLARNALTVLANGKSLVLPSRKNPFWHGKDWVVYTPLITVPMSVYGRSYMEDFGCISRAFTHLTNLILDAVYTNSLNVFAFVPEMLRDPSQGLDVHPGKIFELNTDFGQPKDFMHSLELGGVSRESVEVWQALKNELREAAGLNEIGLGQFAPKGRTSATEVMETQASSSAIIRSVAQTIEGSYLNTVLDLVWKTGLQHAKADDRMLKAAAGAELWPALIGQRRELIEHPVTFQARGISTLINRGQMLRNLLQLLQVLASNEMLLQAFMQVADMEALVNRLFELSNIDIQKVQATERQKMIRAITEPMEQRAGNGTPTAQQRTAANGLAQQAGVARV